MTNRTHYCIRYVYAGIYQYAEFSVENGNVIRKMFNPSYVKTGETPSLEDANTMEEILEIISKFSKRPADIFLINGNIPAYENNEAVKTDINKHVEAIEYIINKECFEFFTNHVIPIMVENNWYISTAWTGRPILISKNEENEWDNIKETDQSYLIEYMCYKLLNDLSLYSEKVDFRQEHQKPILNGFSRMFAHITHEQILSTGLFVVI